MFGLAAQCSCCVLTPQLQYINCSSNVSSVAGLSLQKAPTPTYTRMCSLCYLGIYHMLNARSVCGLLLHHDFGIKARSSGPVSLGSGTAHRSFEVAVIGVRFSSSHNSSAQPPAASRSSVSLPWLAMMDFVAVASRSDRVLCEMVKGELDLYRLIAPKDRNTHVKALLRSSRGIFWFSVRYVSRLTISHTFAQGSNQAP